MLSSKEQLEEGLASIRCQLMLKPVHGSYTVVICELPGECSRLPISNMKLESPSCWSDPKGISAGYNSDRQCWSVKTASNLYPSQCFIIPATSVSAGLELEATVVVQLRCVDSNSFL